MKGVITTYHSSVNDVVVEWNIPNFFVWSVRNVVYYPSPEFSFGGQSWYFTIDPNGWAEHSTFGEVTLRLCKCSFGITIRQEFSLSIKTVKGEKYHKKQYTEVFGKDKNSDNFKWFILRSELLRKRSELVPNGVLTVLCKMKNLRGIISASNAANVVCRPTLSDSDCDSVDSYQSDYVYEPEPSDECYHCNETFDIDYLFFHQNKCMYRPIKCPYCEDVLVLQKWLEEHLCQKENPDAWNDLEQNSENLSVETCTLTKEENGNTASDEYHPTLCDSDSNSGDWYPTLRVILESESQLATSECRHCSGNISVDDLSVHQNRCMYRRIKCPDCLDVVDLWNWLDVHICRKEKPEHAEKNLEQNYENLSVEACTLIDEENAEKDLEQNYENLSVEACTLVEGKNAGNDPEHAYVGASTQHVRESTQCGRASTQHVGASTQTVEASTQTVEEKCEVCASGSSTNFQEKKALHDFKELFLKKEECDVTVKVKGLEFPAHRVILKARSPVLDSTFRHGMKGSATGVLEIDDCEPSSFSDFLCFLYCADVQMITQKNVFDLFTLADKYQVLDLRSKCLEFIKMNLTVDTFCETISLALWHSETELINLSTEYFKKNVPKIIVTVKWQTFLAENPTQSNELLVKFFVPNSS